MVVWDRSQKEKALTEGEDKEKKEKHPLNFSMSINTSFFYYSIYDAKKILS